MRQKVSEKKVSREQVERLFAFTRQHFVEYYDLQAELADHLANAIEERWVQQPGLSFDEALNLEFKKFGVFGFMDVVEKRQLALSKKYYRLIWQYFKKILKPLPLIAMIAAGFTIYKLITFNYWIYTILLAIIFVASSIQLWKLQRAYKKKIKETGKRWLLEDIIFGCGGFGVMLYVPIQVSRFVFEQSLSPITLAIMSGILVLLAIFDYVALFMIPGQAEEHLQKAYPEYRLNS